jgi:multidrug efflux pump subunit AcrA (membrane-fusion protein)
MSVSDFTPAIAGSAKTAQSRLHLSSRAKWILIGLGAVLLIALAWHVIAGLLAGHKKAPPPPSVHVAEASRADVTVMDHTIATVVSPATVQVNAQVTGKLLSANLERPE